MRDPILEHHSDDLRTGRELQTLDPAKYPDETAADSQYAPYEPKDFEYKLKYSLWTDLSGEQTEFQDAFEQLSLYQILKVNVFNLFDFSTIGSEMIQFQKQSFAKSIVQQLYEANKNIITRKKEIFQIYKTIEAERGSLIG